MLERRRDQEETKDLLRNPETYWKDEYKYLKYKPASKSAILRRGDF